MLPKIIINSKSKKFTLKGKLEIKIEGSEIKPLYVEFTFNIILLPLEIILKSSNGSMFWDKRLLLKANSFEEDKNLEFQYVIRNFNENISFLNKNYALKSLEGNQVDEPLKIKQKPENNYIITFPLINKNTEYLEALFKLYFTNTMSIPLEISGKIKKTDFKVFFYDPIFNEVKENNSLILYIFKHEYKKKKSFTKELIFRVQLYDDKKHSLSLYIPYTYYPDKYIQFSLPMQITKINSCYIFKDIREGITIPIIATIPEEKYTSQDNNSYFKFEIDGRIKKELCINLKIEQKKEGNIKFNYFPYKTFFNNSYQTIPKNSIPNDLFSSNNNPVIFYSPYSVKFWKFGTDIIR